MPASPEDANWFNPHGKGCKGERDKLRERVDFHEGPTYEEAHRLLDDLDELESSCEHLDELATHKNNAIADLVRQNEQLGLDNAEKDRQIEDFKQRLRWIADHDGGPERNGLFHDWEWGNEMPDGLDARTKMYNWINRPLKEGR